MGVMLSSEADPLVGQAMAHPAEAGGERRPLDFDDLVHSTGRRFHRAALLLSGGDHHLAEDLLQTTYTKVYAAWGRVSRSDDPVAYARTVLTNTFLSHRRLRRTGERPSAVVPEPDPSYDDPATRLDLLAALRRLTPRDRAVVVSRYWFDRSVADVAADLGMTQTNVRTASRRALTKLRGHLSGDDPDDRADQGDR